jgi:Cd2+/Zn2+-exporting ATPase
LTKKGIEVPEVDEVGSLVYFAVDGKYAGYVVLNDTSAKNRKPLIKGCKKSRGQDGDADRR